MMNWKHGQIVHIGKTSNRPLDFHVHPSDGAKNSISNVVVVIVANTRGGGRGSWLAGLLGAALLLA